MPIKACAAAGITGTADGTTATEAKVAKAGASPVGGKGKGAKGKGKAESKVEAKGKGARGKGKVAGPKPVRVIDDVDMFKAKCETIKAKPATLPPIAKA